MSSSDEGPSSPLVSVSPSGQKRYQDRSISPPPLKRRRQPQSTGPPPPSTYSNPQTQSGGRVSGPPHLSTSAKIESGRLQTTDHLSHFSALLSSHTRHPFPPCVPHLPVPQYASLFAAASRNPRGAHFVVHQHDHPVAGTHYDLRLQINGTSSASWAIMKGLPGDANGRHLGRNAAETRVHCLWNHLIETGSRETGSLLVWDCGVYEVLPRRREEEARGRGRVGTESEDEGEEEEEDGRTQQEKLARAFAERTIRLRLHGTRLPRGYTVYLRLSVQDDVEGRARAMRAAGARPRTRVRSGRGEVVDVETSSEEEEYHYEASTVEEDYESNGGADEDGLSAAEREIRELEDDMVRKTNAYPGAENTVGSVHQRRWFLALDRQGSGFVKRMEGGKTVWVRDRDGGIGAEEGEDGNRWTYPFYVRGAEHERSIITGRSGDEVLRDEGVTGFVRRKGWRPFLD